MMGLFKYFLDIRKFADLFTFYGGSSGGGSPAPTQSTSYNTNVPEYARPYVENMLQSAQKQIYNDDMTTFRPYQPYSSDVNNYFAGFSPLQQSAQQGAWNLQTPGQYGQGSTLAGIGGIGSLGIAGQAAGAGQQYAQQATDPNAVARYMSPYQQNVTDYQKMQAVRDYQIGQPMLKAQAVGQGAFGGSRQAIQESEAQRNLMSQLQGIQATGTQNAFQNAQQQQQFGANLGLQGYQTGLQGLGQAVGAANTLGQLGTQELAAQQGIINTQAAQGAQQQQLEQAKINQAIQDYSTAQQYPYMQLGIMNAMLRGLPLQQTTTQSYQAAPNPISQFGGLAATGLGAYGALAGKAGGGAIKEYAGGGSVKGYAGDEESLVDSGGLDMINRVKTELENMPTEELVKLAKTSSSDMIREKAQEILNMRQAAQTAQMQQPKMPMGIAAAPVRTLNTAMAGGGIVAFAGDGSSLVEEEIARAEREKRDIDAKAGQGRADIGGFGNVKRYIEGLKDMGFAQTSDEEKATRAELLKDKGRAAEFNRMSPYLALMTGGAKAMASKSPFALTGIGEGIEAGVGQYAKGEKDYADMLRGVRAGEIDLNKISATDRNNLMHYATQAATSEANVAEQSKARMQAAQIAADAKEQTAKIAAQKGYDDKSTALFGKLYATNVKSIEDKLGLDKVTQEMRDDIALQTMQQVDTLLKSQGKKGLNVPSPSGGTGGEAPPPPPGFKRPGT